MIQRVCKLWSCTPSVALAEAPEYFFDAMQLASADNQSEHDRARNQEASREAERAMQGNH